jgi:hypothetical protein
MELREHFEGSGQWLFRWRSYLPLVLLIPLAAAVAEYRRPAGKTCSRFRRLLAWRSRAPV